MENSEATWKKATKCNKLTNQQTNKQTKEQTNKLMP
jgi:hypothetical protein